MIHVHPTNRVYIVDLATLGQVGLEARQNFSLEQLRAETSDTTSPGIGVDVDTRRHSLDVGRLPSLRDLLESPSIEKVMFDSRVVAAALGRKRRRSRREECGCVSVMRGVADIQLMELAGRRMEGAAGGWEIHDYRRRGGDGGGIVKTVNKPRDLRGCLE